MLKADFRPLTAHDYRELPQGPPYHQLIEGDLYMAPSPDRFLQYILGNLFLIIRGFLAKHPLGSVYMGPSDVQLSEINVFQPDLYYVSKARQTILTEQGAEGAPDLVVEILSPKTAKYDKGLKRAVYARTGVEELWIVDPELKQAQVYRLAESADAPAATYNVKQTFETRLLPGLKVRVARIFQR